MQSVKPDFRRPPERVESRGRPTTTNAAKQRWEAKQRASVRRIEKQVEVGLSLPAGLEEQRQTDSERERRFYAGLSPQLRREIMEEEWRNSLRDSDRGREVMDCLVNEVFLSRGVPGAAGWKGMVAMARLGKLCGVRWDGRKAEPVGTKIFDKALARDPAAGEWLRELGKAGETSTPPGVKPSDAGGV